jgi:hypothetical protein
MNSHLVKSADAEMLRHWGYKTNGIIVAGKEDVSRYVGCAFDHKRASFAEDVAEKVLDGHDFRGFGRFFLPDIPGFCP